MINSWICFCSNTGVTNRIFQMPLNKVIDKMVLTSTIGRAVGALRRRCLPLLTFRAEGLSFSILKMPLFAGNTWLQPSGRECTSFTNCLFKEKTMT